MAGSGDCGFFGLTRLVVWSLGGCGLAGSGGCGLMLGLCGMGLAWWWRGLAGLGGCKFFGFWSSLRGGMGVCRGLMRWGGVYMRKLNICVMRKLNMCEYARWACKSSLRDSISRWSHMEKMPNKTY